MMIACDRFYAAGQQQWETVARLAAAGEDPAEPYEHGAMLFFLLNIC